MVSMIVLTVTVAQVLCMMEQRPMEEDSGLTPALVSPTMIGMAMVSMIVLTVTVAQVLCMMERPVECMECMEGMEHTEGMEGMEGMEDTEGMEAMEATLLSAPRQLSQRLRPK